MTGHVLQGEEGQEAVAHLLQRAVAVEDGSVVVGGGEVTRGPDDVAGLDHYRLGKLIQRGVVCLEDRPVPSTSLSLSV